MNSIVETITPAKAQEYLFTSLGNRPISKVTVRSYADTMKSGKWMLNGIPVVFDNEGHLIDGHHRLNAVILSGIPVQTSVVRGVEKEAFTTFDCGLHRSLGQLLALQNKKNYNVVASIVLVSETLRLHGKIWANNSNSKIGKRTNKDSYDVYCKNSSAFDYAAEKANTFYNKASILKKSWIGGLYYHLTTVGGYSDEFVSVFFENVCSLVESEHKPMELLRKRIISEKLRGVQLDSKILFAIIVKAWNAYVKGTDLKCLKYNIENENVYPTLILNT